MIRQVWVDGKIYFAESESTKVYSIVNGMIITVSNEEILQKARGRKR